MPAAYGMTSDKLFVGLPDQIALFETTADGDASPFRRIFGPSTGINGNTSLALDGFGNIYVSNFANSSVTVFFRNALGDAPPVRTIAGIGAGTIFPFGLATDSTGNLHILSLGSGIATKETVRITVHGPDDFGNAPPLRTLSRIHLGPDLESGDVSFLISGIAVDSHDNLYFCQSSPGAISVYRPGARDPDRPFRTITGANTGLQAPHGMDFDDSNNLYVANGHSILVFGPGAHGNVAPIRTIKGPHTGLTNCTSIAVDPTGVVYAGNLFPQDEDGHITVHAPGANGDAAPFHTIAGEMKIRIAGLAINKPRIFVPTPLVTKSDLALVASLYGGVTVDGGGFIFIGGVPIPVPVGPLPGDVTAAMIARRDILMALVIEQMASGLNDLEEQHRIRKAALDMLERKAGELRGGLPAKHTHT